MENKETRTANYYYLLQTVSDCLYEGKEKTKS